MYMHMYIYTYIQAVIKECLCSLIYNVILMIMNIESLVNNVIIYICDRASEKGPSGHKLHL